MPKKKSLAKHSDNRRKRRRIAGMADREATNVKHQQVSSVMSQNFSDDQPGCSKYLEGDSSVQVCPENELYGLDAEISENSECELNGPFNSSTLNDSVIQAYGLEAELSDELEIENVTQASSHSSICTPSLPAANLAVSPRKQYFDSSSMSCICPSCEAIHFPRSTFSSCCKKGLVSLPQHRGMPSYLNKLFTGRHQKSASFMSNIRQYNSSVAFASMVADTVSFNTRGPYVYKVHGQVYHYSGCLESNGDNHASYAQLYILDSDMATSIRMKNNNYELDENVLKALGQEIGAKSPFAHSYEMMKRVVEIEKRKFPDVEPNVMMIFDINNSQTQQLGHRGQYNVPTVNEIAAVFVPHEGEVPPNRGIVTRTKDGQVRRISILSPFVDPMVYPLFFPLGDFGWSIDMKLQNGKRMTMREYYAYRLSYRPGSIVHLGGKLFQQYVVDSYCKIQDNNLNFIRRNQDELRAETYSGLTEHLQNEALINDASVGRKIILPATFTGGPRNNSQHYQDAMAMVAKFGKPDLFITFTCNPRWKEISENLLPGQQPHDRPDIVAKAYRRRLHTLIDDLTKRCIFGDTVAHLGVIEFQKRGLPHAHILLTLSHGFKLLTSADIDKVVSAELPSLEDDFELHELVLKHMIHGPCGAHNPFSPCLIDNTCSKLFPKQFSEHTFVNSNGFPSYRRRNGITGRVGRHVVSNQWVVPYNAFLLRKYNAHINVEVCSTIKSVKYLHKYLFKGPDSASLQLRVSSNGDNVLDYDEIAAYMHARYISAPEAMWRINCFPLNFKSHSVTRLAVHCKDQQQVCYRAGRAEEALSNAADRYTTLTAFFKLNLDATTTPWNSNDFKDPRNLLYSDVPLYYRFNAQQGWTPRKRKDKVIGRLHNISPACSERFHLKILLLHCKGVTSFEDIKTINGTHYETFKAAARAMGLIKDDKELENALEEQCLKYTAQQVRQFFSHVLIFSNPVDPVELWSKFKASMYDDFLHSGFSELDAERKAYDEIFNLIDGRVSLSELIPRPMSVLNNLGDFNPALIAPAVPNREIGDEMYQQLNEEQKRIADDIFNAITALDNLKKCFFVSGAGGCGKTFLYKTINHLAAAAGKKVINVAWSGIAAQLLPEGRTVRSVFKLPVPISQDSYLSWMNIYSSSAQVLKETDVFIWDEAPMSPKYALHAVDELLRDITKSEEPFGGKIIILGGDFRQLPPITADKTSYGVIDASLKNSHLWPNFEKYNLKTNMRAKNECKEFLNFLLNVGEGREKCNENGEVSLPSSIISQGNLIAETFGSDVNQLSSYELSKRTILCPKNQQCAEINSEVLAMLNGSAKTYYSIDEAVCEPGDPGYPIEFVNGLTPPGMPDHKLVLKPGAIVMLLRNLNVKKGLCNGTRLIVVRMNEHSIECQTISTGEHVLIPRID